MKLFSARKIDKTYWALVNGSPLPPVGTIDRPLLKKQNPKASGQHGGPEGRDYEVVQIDEEEGQYAKTEYRVIDSLARKFAFVELKPLTGRMHQLRVHMASIGCPIVGDHKYGGGTNDAVGIGVENILHLHARRIVIPALPGGRKLDVSAPLPEHMVNSFQALGLDVPKK
jgi:23S rRNA pseudouridine955/2504/2580 synthase